MKEDHAGRYLKRELEILAKMGIKYDEKIIDQTKECIRIYNSINEGHSGGTIGYFNLALLNKTYGVFKDSDAILDYIKGDLNEEIVIDLCRNAIMKQPISKLTFWESEFGGELGSDTSATMKQNNRISAVFKDCAGSYFLHALIFKGEDEYDMFSGGASLKDGTRIYSHQYIDIEKYHSCKGNTLKIFYIDVIKVPFDETKHKTKEAYDSDIPYVYEVKDESQLDIAFDELYIKRY